MSDLVVLFGYKYSILMYRSIYSKVSKYGGSIVYQGEGKSKKLRKEMIKIMSDCRIQIKGKSKQ